MCLDLTDMPLPRRCTTCTTDPSIAFAVSTISRHCANKKLTWVGFEGRPLRAQQNSVSTDGQHQRFASLVHPSRQLDQDRCLNLLCGGKTSLEGNNSSSICCTAFSIYFLTMASRTGCEIIVVRIRKSTDNLIKISQKLIT